jgi:acetamidase/formamidase
VPSFHLRADEHHLAWDNTLAPAAVVAPGDEVVLELLDASGGQLGPMDPASAIGHLDFNSVNPCTGPISVEGTVAGDELVVTILAIETADWTWTANIPGFGLLHDDFPEPHLWISSVHDGMVTTPQGLEIPARPMIGTIGVAPAAPGRHPLLVPTAAGGNMDVRYLSAGTVLHLPVQVPGALLSAGDTHAVQGDGEVCGTGAECPSTVHLRIDVATGVASSAPRYHHVTEDPEIRWSATTGIGPDLFQAARDATRRAIDLIAANTGLAPVDAYLLLSLVGELRVSEIVNAPNWVVSMQVPTRYLQG